MAKTITISNVAFDSNLNQIKYDAEIKDGSTIIRTYTDELTTDLAIAQDKNKFINEVNKIGIACFREKAEADAKAIIEADLVTSLEAVYTLPI